MWADLPDARAVWPDAAALEDAVLVRLLTAAHEQVLAYAPALADPEVVPSRYVEAEVLQARELWAASKRDGDVLGFESFAVRVRPLSGTVRSLLRPPRGVVRVR